MQMKQGPFKSHLFYKTFPACISLLLLWFLAVSVGALPFAKSLHSQAPSSVKSSSLLQADQDASPQSSNLRQADASHVPPVSSFTGPEISASNQPLSIVERKSPTYILKGPAQITGRLPLRTGEILPTALEILSGQYTKNMK